jgi:SagB-type dehydrogenase family enzyme
MKKILCFCIVSVFIFTPIVMAQDLKPVQLPAPQLDGGKPLMQALKLRQSSRSFDSKAIPLQELSNLLWAAYGINRPESGKRTAPSAMNWQETDVYVVLQEGTYIFEAKAHYLQPVAAGDLRGSTGSQGFVKEAPLNLVYVADDEKASRVNDENKKIFNAVNVGCIVQNVYLYCASQGLVSVVRASVDRDVLSPLLKLKAAQRIVVAQTVGFPK